MDSCVTRSHTKKAKKRISEMVLPVSKRNSKHKSLQEENNECENCVSLQHSRVCFAHISERKISKTPVSILRTRDNNLLSVFNTIPKHQLKKQLISLQHAVEKICGIVAEEMNVTFSLDFIMRLTGLAFRTIGDNCHKLAYFAKHANRYEITNSDIKLYFRCTPQMLEAIEKFRETGCGSNMKSIEYSTENTSNNYEE